MTNRKTTARGFTLVELMVSIALGLLVMVGLGTVYVNVSRTNTEMSKTNSMIESGRFAIDILQEDVEHAGYWGGYVPAWDDLSVSKQVICMTTQSSAAPYGTLTGNVTVGETMSGAGSGASGTLDSYDAAGTASNNYQPYIVLSSVTNGTSAFTNSENIKNSSNKVVGKATATLSVDPYPCQTLTAPDPCLSFSSWTGTYTYALVSMPIQVYKYQATPAVCSSYITNQQPNTDILVVRHAENCIAGTGNCEALDASKVYFQASNCGTEKTTATPSFVLSNTGLTLKKGNCTATADKRRYIANIYYVRNYSVSTGDGIPTLVRLRFGKSGTTPQYETPEQALIDGVEGFVVDLGLDTQGRCAAITQNYAYPPSRVKPSTCAVSATTSENTLAGNRGDGVPDSYVRCGTTGCTAAQLKNVVAVKIFVLARSTDAASTAASDTRRYILGSTADTYDTGQLTDKYRRQLFNTTIRLHNVSGRRETPS